MCKNYSSIDTNFNEQKLQESQDAFVFLVQRFNKNS